jgi:hypothetical protein
MMMTADGDTFEEQDGLAPSYYPATSDPSLAQSITLGSDQTAAGVMLTLANTRLASVSGTVELTDRSLLTSGTVAARLSSTGAVSMPVASARIEPNGHFQVQRLPPGDYVLSALGRAQPGQTNPHYPSVAQVSVAGANITGITLTPPELVSVSGSIRVLGSQNSVQGAQLRVKLESKSASPLFPDSNPTPVGKDLSFDAVAPAGQYLVGVVGLANNWAVRRVRRGPTEVTDGVIDLATGGNLRDVQIEVAPAVPSTTGVVTDSAGRPAARSTVVVFPVAATRRQAPTHYVATVQADANGQFSTPPLPPGDYFLVAVDSIPPSRRGDPQWMAERETTATPVQVRDGQTTYVPLSVSPP